MRTPRLRIAGCATALLLAVSAASAQTAFSGLDLSAADRAVGYLGGLGQTLPSPHLLVRPLQRQEAVLSSRIEGTQASLSDLYVVPVYRTAFLNPFDEHSRRYLSELEAARANRL